MKLLWGACAVLACVGVAAHADPVHVQAKTTCGAAAYSNNQEVPLQVDLTGAPCPPAALPLPSGGSTSALQSAGNTILSTISSVLSTIATNTGLTRTFVPLDVATVTTGGTAVTALSAGHRTKGGFLFNPVGAAINLCINEQATASGTTSAGALICIIPGQAYTLTPSALGVSVVTSDSAHPFAGQGYN